MFRHFYKKLIVCMNLGVRRQKGGKLEWLLMAEVMM